MKTCTVAIMIYGESDSGRDARNEEKYKDLAAALSAQGFEVKSVLYNDGIAETLATELLQCQAILVWVNPIEQGKNRNRLDALLVELAEKGCFVSTHPEVILKIGTKDVLYKTRDMGWGGDTQLYANYEDFVERFPKSVRSSGIRVLKQYRGNGGNGVFKIAHNDTDNLLTVVHAISGQEAQTYSWAEFYAAFKPFFSNEGLLIDQAWNKNISNGMVRCYLSGTKVAGFGYQEINALYTLGSEDARTHFPPSKRYYFTEHCGLFADLKSIMENEWVPTLQKRMAIDDQKMPLIWDADFFINKANSESAKEKYTLCEINVSCVSPFPPSAVKFMAGALLKCRNEGVFHS